MIQIPAFYLKKIKQYHIPPYLAEDLKDRFPRKYYTIKLSFTAVYATENLLSEKRFTFFSTAVFLCKENLK